MIPNVRQEHMLPQVHPTRFNWRSFFWPMKSKGNAGYVQATPYPQGQIVPTTRRSGPLPGTVSMLPHRVTAYRRPAFWNPTLHYKRQEYLVEPPNLPGTAIPYTLFHPVYIPGLQGYSDVLTTNYGVIQGRNQNFDKWNMLAFVNRHPVTGRGSKLNVWKPNMKIPQGPGTGKVFQQPRPYYVPTIVNPSTKS